MEKTNPVKKTVLIIDDDSRHRSLLHTALEHEGFEVVEATNGLDGLRLAQEHNFYCIVTDLKMPQLDGIELIEQLQKIPAVEDNTCPIIVYSNVDQEYIKKESMKKGADLFISKIDNTPKQVVQAIIQSCEQSTK